MISKSDEVNYEEKEGSIGTLPLVPGVDSLGHGYDIFHRYANTMDATISLFNLGDETTKNINDTEYSIPKCVEFRFCNENELKSYSGDTIKEYITSLSNVAKLSGQYDCFTGSVECDFDSKYLTKSDYSYTKVINIIRKWILSLPDESKLKLMLKDTVKNDLDSLDPKKLFDKYGTHYLSELVVGAKATYNSEVNRQLFQSSYSIRTVAEVSYKDLVKSITASEEATYGKSIKNYQAESAFKMHTIGGLPEYASYIMSGQYDKWLDSITKNPQFCDFTDNGLKPIWNLCSTANRVKELEDYFYNVYVKLKQLNVYVTNLDVVFSDSADVPAPAGFVRIEDDINAGHKHDYLFICYKINLGNYEKVEKPPVTDIKVIVSDKGLKEAPDKGYKLIPHDLNSGFGGKSKYIYITYTNDPSKGKPIRGIRVIRSKDYDVPAPSGFYKHPEDLKESTGGDYVFLCTSTDLEN